MSDAHCVKVFAFPDRETALEMLVYARPDRAGRVFTDAYRCRIESCRQWHLTTKQGPPAHRRRR